MKVSFTSPVHSTEEYDLFVEEVDSNGVLLVKEWRTGETQTAWCPYATIADHFL